VTISFKKVKVIEFVFDAFYPIHMNVRSATDDLKYF